jgi:hypothetical protein
MKLQRPNWFSNALVFALALMAFSYFCAAQSVVGAESDDKAIQLQGVIVGPGGQAASGAAIGFSKGDDLKIMEANARYRGALVDPWRFGGATVIANSDGSFATTIPPRADTIVVVHDLGCGSASIARWTNGTTIQLRPWASLRGRMLVNGIPAANRPIAAVICILFNSNVRFYLLGFETTTDAEGKFVFERLPPGVVDLVQKVAGPEGRAMYSHWSSFVADATLPQDEVVYSLAGRDLTGFLTDHRGDAVNWRDMNIFASLVSTARGPVDEFSPMAGPPGRPAPMFVSTVTANGEFSASAIPPGEYVLTVSCSEPSKPTRRFVTKIVAPPGPGPFALGGIVVTNIAK